MKATSVLFEAHKLGLVDADYPREQRAAEELLHELAGRSESDPRLQAFFKRYINPPISKHPEYARDFCEQFVEVLSRRRGERTPLGLTVVTASDATYFHAAQLLYVSLRTTHDLTRFVWHDLGLTPKQRQWCEANGVELRRLSSEKMPRHAIGWQTWNKPFYITDTAAAHDGPILWLDADTLAVGPLDWIEEAVRHRPFVVHCFSATGNLGYRRGMRSLENRPRLYGRYPVPQRFVLDRPNAGVFACHPSRDRRLLDDWQFMVGEAARDDDVRACLRWYDQGALQWALEKNRMVNVVTHEQRFNDGLAVKLNVKSAPCELIVALEELSPQTRVLHFAGDKPYKKLPPWMPFQTQPPLLATFILGHEAERLAACPRGPHIKHVYLPALDPSNDLAESRVFHADVFDASAASYIALSTQRWDEKYRGVCLPLRRLGEVPLLPRVVWGAQLAPIDWLDQSERDHPGMRAIVEALADVAGIDQGCLRSRVPWSNNFIAHRTVVREIAAFHRQWWPWCAARAGGYDTSRWQPSRHGSYLAERLTMICLAGRLDLEMRQLPL